MQQGMGSRCQWRVHISDYVRMTRIDWCNLSGSKYSIPVQEHSLVHKTHRWTMLKNRLLPHCPQIEQHTQHCITHIAVLGIYTLSLHALLLIRRKHKLLYTEVRQHAEVGMRHMERVTAILKWKKHWTKNFAAQYRHHHVANTYIWIIDWNYLRFIETYFYGKCK